MPANSRWDLIQGLIQGNNLIHNTLVLICQRVIPSVALYSRVLEGLRVTEISIILKQEVITVCTLQQILSNQANERAREMHTNFVRNK
jgi:hypothetical protein